MTVNPGSRGFLSGRLRRLTITVVVIGLMAFAVWLLLGFGVYTMRGEVSVLRGYVHYPDRLVLVTGGPCQGDQQVSLLRETDTDVQVKVVAPSRSSFQGGSDCEPAVEVQLQEPLGDRIVIDKHTGQRVSVEAVRPTGEQDQAEESGTQNASPDEAAKADGAGVEDPPPAEAVPPEIRDAVSDAELQDLQAVAEQYGMTLQEAFDRYAWNDNFSRAVSRVREAAPATFAGAEIVDGSHARIAFTGTPPKAALDIIDTFTSSHSGVAVEVRTGQSITAAELEEAIPAVHYAVYKTPEVLNANTSFNSETGQIEMLIVLGNTTPDSILDELLAIAEKRLIEVTRLDILDDISISIVRSKHPDINATE